MDLPPDASSRGQGADKEYFDYPACDADEWLDDLDQVLLALRSGCRVKGVGCRSGARLITSGAWTALRCV
jgi:hypothetical protein